jgi:hypothetical protein
MSSRALTSAEKASWESLLEDFRLLFSKEEIKQEEIDDVLRSLKSHEAKSYIENLRYGSKPETALRESFIAGKSILLKYLFGEAIPEVRSNGFIDYLIKDETGHAIVLELKPLFEAEFESDKAGRHILKRLRQKKIKPESYREQILKYIREGEAQYVILTNLKEWFFYSKDLNPKEVKYFYSIDLFNFVKEYDVIGNLRDYLERKEFESVRYELDKKFLESLKTWVNKLSEVEFTVDERRKLELIIGMINKFIFIQTLDDYGVVEFNWIRKCWERNERMWQKKGKLMVLKRFFNEIDEWFYTYYDTELFREKILEYIKEDPENIDKFYKNLKSALGLTYLQTPVGDIKGIMQYNFRYIDEDVLGKAYEIFLGEVRKEEGIYYTPKYITKYIAENTVGKLYDELLAEIKKKLEDGNFDEVKGLVSKFVSIRVLDPACGSGSFLIKAIRIIFEKYKELNKLIEENIEKHYNYRGSLLLPGEDEVVDQLTEVKRIIGPSNDRELIARILVRHIHGVDLDQRALEVAKVNIWLEAIKLAPKEFRYDRLPSETNYILPNLEMNLRCGDSLVGLPEKVTVEYISDKYQMDLIKLFDLRRKYLEDPTNPELIEEIENIKRKIRNELDEKLKEYLEEKISNQILPNQTKPFHWALEFWYVFFNENGTPLTKEQRGFDVVIGNPPYIEYRLMVKKLGTVYAKFLKAIYKCAQGQFDITIPFTEKSLKLLKKGGILSYIMTNKFMIAEYGYRLRDYLLNGQVLEEIIDVSNIKVFKDAATYPVIFIVRRLDENLQYNVRIGSPSEKEMVEGSPSLTEVPKSIFTSELPLCILTPYITGMHLKLFKKVQSGHAIPENLFKCGVAQTGFSDKIKSSTEAKEGDYIRFVQGEDITPFYIIPPDKYFPLSLLSEEKITEFKQRKIMIPGIVKDIYCGYDTIGMGCGRVYYVTENESPYPLSYLAALFNSSLFKFIYRVVYGMSHLSGDYLRINSPYLRIFRVKEIDKELASKFENFVSLLMTLKEAHYKIFKTWREWCTQLKKGEYSLYRILSEDARFMQMGEFSKAWTSKATFYPTTESKMLNTVFNDFRVVGEVNKHEIKIYGLDENDGEKLVYEMEFSNRELMLHIYCSLIQALESRAKIENLSQLLEKTKVPIIKEDSKSSSELTPNIIKKAVEEFEKWLEEKKIKGLIPDIVKIDNEIEDLEAEIDALVFKLYGLDENEIKTVFESLRTPTTYQSKVLEFFRRLK